MILDATAGNRTIYTTKEVESIIYIDMEKRLVRKPTIFADNTQTPFLDKQFSDIIYDPPHAYGAKTSVHSFPDPKMKLEAGYSTEAAITYYGWDKYKTQMQLIGHVFKAQKEFYRILKDDGLLWLKWNEMCISANTIMHLFDDWVEVMRIFVSQTVRPMGKKATYWICLAKKKRMLTQTTLL